VVSSYSLDWTVPTDGKYYFVFFNYAPSGQGAFQAIGTFSLQYPVSESATLTLSSTVGNSIVFTTAETLSSEYSSTVQPFPWSSLLMSYIGYLVVIAVLAAIVVGAILISGRRAREPTIVEARKGVQFCTNCGAELRPGSKFCNKCGSAQD
jgi:ribosomal protein L40E